MYDLYTYIKNTYIQSVKKIEAERKKIQNEKKILMCRKKLEMSLDKLIPKLKEVNQVAQEMEKPIVFELKLQQRSDSIEALTATEQADRLAAMDPVVVVTNKKTGQRWIWSQKKFDQRRFMIMDQFHQFQEGLLQKGSAADDPFWDPPSSVMIGRAFMYLKALSHLVEIDEKFDVVDIKGKGVAKISVKILPMGLDNEELDYLREPKELLGMSFKLKIVIQSVEGLPDDFAYYPKVKFLFQDKNMETSEVPGKSVDPKFGWENELEFNSADEELLDYFLHSVAVFEVRGYQKGFTPDNQESKEARLKSAFEEARAAWRADQTNEKLKDEFKSAKRAYYKCKAQAAQAAEVKVSASPAEQSTSQHSEPSNQGLEALRQKFEQAREVWKADQGNEDLKNEFRAAKKAYYAVKALGPVEDEKKAGGGNDLESLKSAFEAAREAWKAEQGNEELKANFKASKKAFYDAKKAAE